jgi:hypothetical protein
MGKSEFRSVKIEKTIRLSRILRKTTFLNIMNRKKPIVMNMGINWIISST